MVKSPHIILLFVLVSSGLCIQYQDLILAESDSKLSRSEFELPDLGINHQDPNCQNAANLVTAANSDVARLQNFVAQDLAQSIQEAQQALSLTQQACKIENNLRPQASLLQTQTSSSSSKSRLTTASQLAVALEDLSTRMSPQQQHHKSNLYNTLIATKATQVSTMLVQVSHRRALSAQDSASAGAGVDGGSITLDSACTDAETNAQNLVDYLSYLNSQIADQTLKVDLPQRISTLNAFIADCAAPITQTGQLEKIYFNTASPLVTKDKKVRTDDITVTFPQAFASVPSVGIALTGVDVDKETPSILIAVQTVTTKSLVVRVTANSGVAVYGVQFSYIATLSDRSGIYIATTSINKGDADFNKISGPQSSSAMRGATKPLNPPSNLKNVKSIAFIRGFEFGNSRNARLTVFTSADSNSIVYQTWYDTTLNSVDTTVLFWSGNDASVSTKLTQTTYAGVQLQGSGERNEKTVIDTGAYKSSPQMFLGLYYFDGNVENNYRLRQSISGSDPKKTFTSSVWSDTRLYWVKTGIVMSCPTVNKATCLA